MSQKKAKQARRSRAVREAGVDPSTLPDVLCPVCGCGYFQPTVHIKMLSEFDINNPTGKNQPVIHQVFCCMGQTKRADISGTHLQPCGHIIDMSDSSTFTLKSQKADNEN
jgi:hypothetical protein